jgi:hypothetical protein
MLLLKLYGENGTVISAPLFYELCKHVQFLSRRVQCRYSGVMGIADGLREKTSLRFLPSRGTR